MFPVRLVKAALFYVINARNWKRARLQRASASKIVEASVKAPNRKFSIFWALTYKQSGHCFEYPVFLYTARQMIFVVVSLRSAVCTTTNCHSHSLLFLPLKGPAVHSLESINSSGVFSRITKCPESLSGRTRIENSWSTWSRKIRSYGLSSKIKPKQIDHAQPPKIVVSSWSFNAVSLFEADWSEVTLL